MNFNEITVNDLQPKRSAANTTNDAVGQSADNRIRKAWSLQMPDAVKAKFAHFPGDVKRQLYKSFDQETNEIWVELLAKANEDAAKAGATVTGVDIGEFMVAMAREFCVTRPNLDFVEAENSTGFHAPQEAARILGESINFSRQGQNALRGNTRPGSQPAREQKTAHRD